MDDGLIFPYLRWCANARVKRLPSRAGRWRVIYPVGWVARLVAGVVVSVILGERWDDAVG